MDRDEMDKVQYAYGSLATTTSPWTSVHRSTYPDVSAPGASLGSMALATNMSVPLYAPSHHGTSVTQPHAGGSTSRYDQGYATSSSYPQHTPSVAYSSSTQVYHHGYKTSRTDLWDGQDRYSPTDSVDDILVSPNLSDYSPDRGGQTISISAGKGNSVVKGRSQRRPSNRDEFDGPHQFLQRPPPEVIALQERELPHLPTNLLVQEQDEVLNKVNDRLSQCAYDFVAKYQFPIPLTQDMRPVERPQDREWTEWVYLLKRLATKRRVPARVLYNGQIKQFVTILENSLEMRHAAKHQSRPPKDDRNILQLISAGIQVAKILKDASAMDYLDKLYVFTEQQIQDRTSKRHR